MQIAVMSDIHGNREAFDSCLAHLFRDDFEQQNLGAWDTAVPTL